MNYFVGEMPPAEGARRMLAAFMGTAKFRCYENRSFYTVGSSHYIWWTQVAHELDKLPPAVSTRGITTRREAWNPLDSNRGTIWL